MKFNVKKYFYVSTPPFNKEKLSVKLIDFYITVVLFKNALPNFHTLCVVINKLYGYICKQTM